MRTTKIFLIKIHFSALSLIMGIECNNPESNSIRNIHGKVLKIIFLSKPNPHSFSAWVCGG